MKTKFIGLEGFNEIESLSTTNKKAYDKKFLELTKAQKTVRFVKRAIVYFAKSLKEKSKNLLSFIIKKINQTEFSGKKTVSSKTVKAKSTQISLLDRCYRDNRTGNLNEFNSSAKDAISSISFARGQKFAHSASNTGYHAHTILKKRALLAVVTCLIAVTLSCVTVASALDFSGNNAIVAAMSSNIKTDTASNNNSISPENSDFHASTADEAFRSEAYVSIAKALINDDIQTGCCGLYIDGELIGATNEVAALKDALEKVLVDYRADYDDKTTTEFANDVVVKSGDFTDSQIMSAEDIMNAADGKFSIALSTDILYTREIKYEEKTEYDDSEPSSYEEVKTEGQNGEEKVTVRTTFTDGVQTDAVETDVEVLKKAVDKVVVRGSKDGIYSSNESSSSSSADSSSSSGNFSWPLPYTHNITSLYEWRWGRMHWGIDISDGGVYGQPISASDSGTVIHSGDLGDGYGNYVIIDHGNGYQTLYGHCSSLAVSSGQYVSKGETIGYVGSTGNSTGPHLHFEIIYNSNKLDPLQFVS